MNLVDRAKKIMFEPKNEWVVIEQEETSIAKITTSYLIPLSLIPAIASFIGYGLIGIEFPFFGHISSVSWGIKQAIVSLLATIGGAFISAYIIDTLAPSFSAVKNLTKAFALVVYAYTPSMVAGIFLIYPALGILASIAGIYGLYLLYLGLSPMMKPAQDKVTTYFIVSLIVTILVFIILSAILSAIFIGSLTDIGMMR